MAWALGIGSFLFGIGLIGYVWWSSRDYRKLAKETRGLVKALAELRADMARADHANSIIAAELKRERVQHAREIAAVNQRLERTRRILVSHGGSELLAERLRDLLSPLPPGGDSN